MPRSAREAHSLRSFALVRTTAGCLRPLANSHRGTSSPEPPYSLARGDPDAPLRSRGSLAALVRSRANDGKLSPPAGELSSGDFVPCTPYSLARGDPDAQLRSRGPLATLVRSRANDVRVSPPAGELSSRGFVPCPPFPPLSRGPRCPAPLARLTRCARSLSCERRQAVSARWRTLIGGLRPPHPLTRSLAGTPMPRSAREAHSLRSFALVRTTPGCLRPLANSHRRTSSPPPPYSPPPGDAASPPPSPGS